MRRRIIKWRLVKINSETDITIQKEEREHWTEKSITISLQTALVAGIALVAILSRLWGLGWRVMSHDESLHVYYSWLLATGKGFTHDPMLHGPLLFEATALVNLFAGANDFSSRLVPALLGIFLVVGIPQLLKPWLGKWGSLAASGMLLISPFMLFYSRYIRHDPILIVWLLVLTFAMLAYLHDRRDRYLYIASVALALMFATMEVTFIYLAIFATFLIGYLLLKYRLNWRDLRASPQFDLLILLSTLGAFFSSPIALLPLNPLWQKITGAPFVALSELSVQGIQWAVGTTKIHVLILLVVFWVAAILIGLAWGGWRWAKFAGIFLGITIPLFTTFFTNLAGMGTGFVGSLGYWLTQQDVARGGQPWYYFFIVLPLYEFLPLLGTMLAAGFYALRFKRLSIHSRVFAGLCLWWALGIFVALSLAGEKMPWHSVQVILPFILLSAWFVGQLLSLSRGRILKTSILALLAVLALLTLRTSYFTNYVNYDYSTEFVDYAHGAPGVRWVLDAVQQVANLTGEGKDVRVAYDADVSWPMTWYLRNYPKGVYMGDQPSRDAVEGAVVVAGPKSWKKIDSLVGPSTARYEVIRMWWPLEDYKNLNWERIRFAITDPAMRSALWQIIWSRDYSAYAALTQQSIDPPRRWPLQESLRVYIPKEIAAQLNGLKITEFRLPDITKPNDAYTSVRREVVPAGPPLASLGLNAPRNLAISPDGSIVVLDSGNSRVLKIDPSGKLINSWGSKSASEQDPAPGTFNEPWGVAVDSQGLIYVADTWNHRIQKFDPQGNFLTSWGGPGQAGDGLDRFWGPRGVAVSTDGKVYVTDTGNKRVLVFDPNGKFLFAFGQEGEGRLDEPVGIAIGPDRKVYVADTWNLRVAVYSAEGQYDSSWPVQGWDSSTVDNKPYLAVDARGNVYVTDPENYRVIAFSPQGVPRLEFGQYGAEIGAFGLPTGLAVAQDGSLWVADAENNRLVKYLDLLP